jgi:hypothetical protein
MEGGKAMRRRLSVLMAMAVMLAMMLTVVAPAMAARQGVLSFGVARCAQRCYSWF